MIRDHLEQALRQLLQRLMRLPDDVEQALDDLLDMLPDWVTAIPAQVAEFINDTAGINLASWPAFLASLEDGKGIDLAAIPKIVAALEGIPWESGDPGAVLAAITAAGGTITSRLRGLVDISWLTDEHQNLVAESGYDAPITVGADDDPAITQDPTDGVPDSDPLGCLRIALDGQNHERIGELIAVGKGWELSVSSGVKRESVTAAAGALRVELQPYSLSGEVATPVGARVVVASHAAPAGSSTGWESISGSWTVPSDGSVTHVAVIPGVTAGATSGVAKFDDTTMFATQSIPQAFVNELTDDLASLLNWVQTVVDTMLTRLGIPPTGTLLDRIHDLGDEIQLMQERGEDALEGLADKLGLTDWANHLSTLLSDPGSLLGQLTMGKVTGLLDWQQVQNQINALLSPDPDLMIVPINAIVQDVKDFIIGHRNKTARLTGDGKLNSVDILGLLSQSQVANLVSDLGGKASAATVAAVQDFVNNLVNAILQAIRGVPVVGGTLANIVSEVGGLNTTANQAQSTADAVQAGIVNGWSGGPTSGADADTYNTLSAVRDAILSGYTVETFTSSGTWSNPSGLTELVVICVGGGGNGTSGANGQAGSGSTAAGGTGGTSGGYIAASVDPSTLPSTVTVTVGAAGNTSSFGSYVVSSAGGGGIASSFGYSATSSTPGAGGNGGGTVTNTGTSSGAPGTPSAAGAGGAGGSIGGGSGTAGGSVSVAAVTKCGGGGGGGGGSGNTSSRNGGTGGAGGYPGGGGGGGGAGMYHVFSGAGGGGGSGAAGVVWVFSR